MRKHEKQNDEAIAFSSDTPGTDTLILVCSNNWQWYIKGSPSVLFYVSSSNACSKSSKILTTNIHKVFGLSNENDFHI